MSDESRAGGAGLPGQKGEPRPRQKAAPEKEIVRRIKEDGPITFAEFMGLALYWHEGGYYTSCPERWGKGGDYITSIDVSPAFARLLGRQTIEMWDALGRSPAFELIEAGAGRGWLSKGILEYLKEACPELGNSIKIRLIEKNPLLRKTPKGQVTWHEDLKELKGPIKGVVVSNELVDSLPVHIVEQRGGLKEVFVSFDNDDGSFVEVLKPPSTPAIEDYFKELDITLIEGQRAEVNLVAKEWIKEAGVLLSSGFVITIDYGLPAKELYSPERKGSLLCHFRHTLNDNPFVNVGLQDITAHVDFTALVSSGKEAGLELTGFTTQKNFLLGLGIEEDLHEIESVSLESLEKINENRALGRLVAPGGMGDTFKVLIQHKGIKKPELKGLSFKDMSRYL
ncbi:MAG: SAM-dependent methyltransferase [Deltaproteobacteria bacterium]|nr:SAM-dependent methyltransferase [Deltaproteobacteria bacterium]